MQDKETQRLDWALSVFRPILKDLNISKLNGTSPTYILGADYPQLIRGNMANCLLVVSQYDFTDKENTGIFVWRYRASKNSFVLYILLNKTLFENDNLKIMRKAVSIHEFVHCVAAMLTFSRLKTEDLIIRLQEKMKKQFHYIKTSDGYEILKSLRKVLKNDDIAHKTFDDEHFRTGNEDFIASYADLYEEFLLSYKLFCETGFFDADKRKLFLSYKKQHNSDGMVNVLLEVIKSLSEDKCLDITFIVNRLKKFLPKILTHV